MSSRISIFGMGYVGVVCAGLLARRGNRVIGVDISQAKVDAINAGSAPIVEPGLNDLLQEVTASGALSATRSIAEAVAATDISFICVGTPSRPNGDLDFTHVVNVCRQIGVELRNKPERHLVVVRSTVLPGTVRTLVIPALEEASGKKAGEGFSVAANPEFLRECTAIRDFDNPPFTLIGTDDPESGKRLLALYEGVAGEKVVCETQVAEMIKYTCNAWHAVKVGFANEIGTISKQFGVDGRQVMDIVCLDRVLNISTYYMKPGFAFGGSCLPKDLRALTYRANQADLKLPLLNSLLHSNERHVQRGLDLVTAQPSRRVGLLGLSFKSGTDDLRESPFVELAERLIGKGYDLSIYDRYVDHARVHGANKEYINSKIPHLSALMRHSVEDVVDKSDVIVLSYPDQEFREKLGLIPANRKVIDLASLERTVVHPGYEGICW